MFTILQNYVSRNMDAGFGGQYAAIRDAVARPLSVVVVASSCAGPVERKTPHRKTMRGKQLDSRGGQIRTGDLLLPKQARYRATLRPEEMNLVAPAAFGQRSVAFSR